jgi:type III restriction enzyme
MELKEYQKKTLEQVKLYLDALADFKAKNDKAVEIDPELSINFPLKAWEKVIGRTYYSKKNGLDEELPDFYIKIPTGGGKTVLACHTIDLINKIYLKKQTGIVLWIVPTTQIYRQTLANLKNREHPYRQVLDISSGGRTEILEKTDKFTALDIKENLVVMLLMLPSASRQNKEVLKVFKDSGSFADFFPQEDDRAGNEKLLKQFPNLHYFGDEIGFFGKIVKTSLGNTLRILKPIIIIDEGHKAYSEIAQKTIRDFNPSIVVELSATPPQNSNNLVNISGQELNLEEMIKLDLHITNKAELDWQNTMLASVEKRNFLEQKAKEYEANTGEFIRPICLVQVERTGKDQKGTRYIHAEDVKDYLIKQCGIPNEQIAIKSSEKDDIEGIELLAKDCHIRYIITKHALQEGWDCAFAYILTILNNPASELSITQLVGRILRQPKARKTKVKDLDESYVFCFRPRATEILENIRKGFEGEGLGDLAGKVVVEEGESEIVDATKERIVGYRDKFKKFEGKIYLPKFVIQENGGWRDVNYEMDILSRIDWSMVNFDGLMNISLSEIKAKEENVTIGISVDTKKLIETKEIIFGEGGLEIDNVFITRQILDLVPNPWIAFDIAKKVIDIFLKKYDEQILANNLVFIIDELRKHLEKERDRLGESVFREQMSKKVMFFFLLHSKGGYELPSRIKTKKNKMYPDFILSEIDSNVKDDYSKIFVIETKGWHLKNEDTDYKKNIFEFCNKIGIQKNWTELNTEFDQRIEFQVIFEDEWKAKMNKIFGV